MMRKLVTAIVVVPLLIIFLAFAVANRETITIAFDPFDSEHPAYALRAPLFILIVALFVAGMIFGGLIAWVNQRKWRRRARRAEADLRTLKTGPAARQWPPEGKQALPPAQSDTPFVLPPAA
jgi:uncharacterized integral membrane protein